jgi:hypothetical protein
MDPLREKDLEVGDKETHYNTGGVSPDGYNDGAVRGETFEAGDTMYHRLQRLAGKYGVEQRGIERVPEDERTDNRHPYLNTGTMVSPILIKIFWRLLLTNLIVASLKHGCFFICYWCSW